MPAAVLDLDGDLIIEQGSYWSMTLLYPGNVTGSYLRGDIRKNFGGELLARFQFGTGVHSAETNQTSFLCYLNSGTTKKLPIPVGEAPYWRYDILFQPPSKEQTRLIQGKVFISPGVTE